MPDVDTLVRMSVALAKGQTLVGAGFEDTQENRDAWDGLAATMVDAANRGLQVDLPVID